MLRNKKQPTRSVSMPLKGAAQLVNSGVEKICLWLILSTYLVPLCAQKLTFKKAGK